VAPGRRRLDALREFLAEESTGGLLLVAAAVVALAWANSPWSASYFSFWHHELTVGVGRFTLTDDLQHWVNDGLMVVFFFVVGLEIKRELISGELADPRKALLPVMAAVGGMVVGCQG